MDLLEKLFKRHRTKDPRPPDESGRYAARPYLDKPRGDPRYAHAAEHEHGEPRAFGDDPPNRSSVPGMLGALARHKTLLVVAAALILVVAIGGVIGLVLLLPVAGTLVAAVGAQELSTLLTDLPRLVNTLLVEVPKALLNTLAPLLQLKNTLEGKA